MAWLLLAWLALPLHTQAQEGDSPVLVETPEGGAAGRGICFITTAACPAHPRTYPVPRFPDHDTLDGELSSRSPQRCLSRALEYHEWCGARFPVKAEFVEGARKVASATAGARPVSLEADFRHRPLPSSYDTDYARLGTHNGWAPGSPRRVTTGAGSFAVLLRNESEGRNRLRFDLARKASGRGDWTPILPNLGPAESDPVLVADSEGRLHVLFPGSRNDCDKSMQGGNVAHLLVRRAGKLWRATSIDTSAIWEANPSDCRGAPRTQRFGASIDGERRSLDLVFYDLAGQGHRVGFASFDLERLRWSPMRPVAGSGAPPEGAGYSYVTSGRGEISFITTHFDAADYRRVSWLRSRDAGASWRATVLCEAQRHCLTGDILRDGDGRIHLMFQVDATAGGAIPLPSAEPLAGRRANYLLSTDRDAPVPIVDAKDPEGPSPDWRAALGELDGLLVAIGPAEPSRLGLWVSGDSGASWHFRDLSPKLNPGIVPHQFRLEKPQYGSSGAGKGRLGGLFTDASKLSAVKTFEFELSGLSLTVGADRTPSPETTCAEHARSRAWAGSICDGGDGSCAGSPGGSVKTGDCAACCDSRDSCGHVAQQRGWTQPACDVKGSARCGLRGAKTWDCERCCETVRADMSCKYVAELEGWPDSRCNECGTTGVGTYDCPQGCCFTDPRFGNTLR